MLNVAGRFLGRKVEEMPHKVVKYGDSAAEESIVAWAVSGTGAGLGTPAAQELSCVTLHSPH